MRSSTAHGALLLCLAIGLAGCSTTKSSGTASRSWWPFASKSKNNSQSTSMLGSALTAPGFDASAGASPTVNMPGSGYGAAPYGNGTQYPVTPYPNTNYAAPGAAPAYTADASNGYMPPSASAAPANPYAAVAPPANPYAAAAPPANAYPATSAAPAQPYAPAAPQASQYSPPGGQAPAYTANGQYGASPYPGGPTNGADSPYTR